MAIVDGKRIPGLEFYKVKGRKEWVVIREVDHVGWEVIGPCVETDTDADPRTLWFRYCSGVSQPVFLDSSMSFDGYPSRGLTSSSWRKLPEGWRAAFRDHLSI